MQQLSVEDLRKIREDSLAQAQTLSALKQDIEIMLSQCSPLPTGPVSEETETQSRASSKPALISRADRMQTRLSQLAAALSPSNRSICINDRSPKSSLQNFSIHTPPLPPKLPRRLNEEIDEAIIEVSRSRLREFVSEIKCELDKKILELQTEKESIETLRGELLVDSTDREKKMLERILESVEALKVEFPVDDLKERISSEIHKNRIHNTEALSSAAIAANRQGFAELTEQVATLTNTLESRESDISCFLAEVRDSCHLRISQGLREVHQHVDSQLSQLKNHIVSQLDNKLSPSFPLSIKQDATSLIDENQSLRNLIRRMKLCLAKWRIDYLNHAQAQHHSPPSPKREQKIAVGDHFIQLSRTLARMWSALGPSADELIDFLGRIEDVAASHGNLADVFKDECSRHVEKLPIAELIARREFLIAKRPLTGDESEELEDLTANLTTLIRDYERKHKQSFVYDGEEYLRFMSRVDIRT